MEGHLTRWYAGLALGESRRERRRAARPGRRPKGWGRFLELEGRVLLSGPTATFTTLGASPVAPAYGGPVTFTATVVAPGGGTPTGTVTFEDGTTTLGSAPLKVVGGADEATFTTTALGVGAHSVLAVYAGAGGFAASDSTIVRGSIATVAGALPYAGDGGPATLAHLDEPSGVAVDASGDLFIADTLNNEVREVDRASGTIVTVAGDGAQGGLGDGGAATLAELDQPSGVAVDGAGHLFIADTGNNSIREVDLATGTIVTIAGDATAGDSGDGGAATLAQLDGPSGVAVDGAGNLYIADTLNNSIREVSHASRAIVTVAGDGTAGSSGDGGAATLAELDQPGGVALDASGDLFIADTVNNVVREVSAASHAIATVAGNGTPAQGGDGGPATLAQLYRPSGVALDASGNLFIADSYNNVVREVARATGTIATVAGNGTAGEKGDGGAATTAELDQPSGVAVDASGDLFVADTSNNVIREAKATGTIAPVAGTPNSIYGGGDYGDGGPATAAVFLGSTDVAVDASGDLFIVDPVSNAVREVDRATGTVATIAGEGGYGYSGDGGPATSAALNQPSGIALDGAGHLFIADTDNNVVREVDLASGTITTVAGNGVAGYHGNNLPATAAELSAPTGVAVDGSGHLFIADMGNDVVREVVLATGTIATVAGDSVAGDSGDGGKAPFAALDGPRAVAVDGAGDLFIADEYNNAIREVKLATATISTVAGDGAQGGLGDGGPATLAQLSSPSGLAVDGAGDLFIADRGNGTVREVLRATGAITTVAGAGGPGDLGDGGPATRAQFNDPYGVALDRSGDLFIADTGNNVVREVPTLAVASRTGVELTASAASLATGQPVTFTATVAALSPGAGVPTGTVTFNDGPDTLGTGTLAVVDGVATASLTVATLAYGSHQIVAEYGGDHLDVAGKSAKVGVTAGPDRTSTVVTPSPAAPVFGQAVTLTAVVGVESPISALPTGSVTFEDGTTALGSAPLRVVNGIAEATITGPALAAGPHAIVAVYGGGAGFAASISTPARSTIESVAPGLTGYASEVSVDAAGDLFIVDAFNNVVREFDRATGTVRTVAGDGQSGYSGDGGPATAATLNGPSDVAADGAGDLFIADSFNNVIREVMHATGIIRTVAGDGQPGDSGDGGPATAATLNIPSGIAVDGAGHLFVDDFNSAVREVDLASGTIRTVAGNGTQGGLGDGGPATLAQLFFPAQLAVDGAGDLFIADSGNAEIREVDHASGTIHTVAGDGTRGVGGDGGPAIKARLNGPAGVAVDGAGDLFIADSLNNLIREVDHATGIITTIAGGGTMGDGVPATAAVLDNPGNLAVDAAGDVFFVEAFKNVVREVSAFAVAPEATSVALTSSAAAPVSGQPETFTAAVTLQTPDGATPTGTVTFLDGANALGSSPLRLVGGVAEAVLTPPSLGVGPHSIVAVYGGAAGFSASRSTALRPEVTTVAGLGADSGDGGPATAATLNRPKGVAVDAAGDLFIADTANDVIREVDHSTGIITTIAGDGKPGYRGDGGPATLAELDQPRGVAVDGAGHLFIADANNNVVREVDLATGTIATVVGGGTSNEGGPRAATAVTLSSPTGLALDGAGDLFIADSNNNVVRKVNLAAGTIANVAGDGSIGDSGDGGPATVAQITNPTGLAVDGEGDLFIADTYDGVVREVDHLSGTIITVAGSGQSGPGGDGGPATAAGLDFPFGLAVDGAGDLFIADTRDHAIRKVVLANGIITTIAGDGRSGETGDGGPASAATLESPQGLAVDAAGDLFIADAAASAIREVVRASGTIARVAGLPALADGGSATAAALNQPMGVTVDAVGNVFIADTSNNVVREVSRATGKIETVAGDGQAGYAGDGGPATAATLHSPSAIILDAAGDLFIADAGNHVVRELDHATGKIATIAGDGQAGYAGDGGPATAAALGNISALAVDAAGDLFIADSTNDVVREVDRATGKIATIAGGGQPGSSGDGGPATAASFGNLAALAVDAAGDLFLADAANNVVREVVLATGLINTPVGTGQVGRGGDGGPAFAASLNAPDALAVDAAGDLFIADAGNHVVRELDHVAGIITTVAGDGRSSGGGDGGPATAAEFRSLGGLAVDGAGDLFVADAVDGTIREAHVLTIGPDSTATSVTGSANAPVFGQPVTFTATVRVLGPGAGPPIGTVTFKDGTTILGTGALKTVNGFATATFTTSTLTLGSHAINAEYGGAPNDLTSTSSPLELVVGRDATKTSVLASVPSPSFGEPVTLTATVVVLGPGVGIPTGTVTFQDGTVTLGTGTLKTANGVSTATFTTSILTVGAHSIVADYGGDVTATASTTSALDLKVGQDPTRTAVGVLVISPYFGQGETFTATVGVPGPGSSIPTGTVTFKDGADTLGTGTLSLVKGVATATFATGTLAVGPHSITAVYGGNPEDQASTSPALVLDVKPDVTGTTLSASPAAPAFGQPETFTATVRVSSPGAETPTGVVTFKDGAAPLGTGTLTVVDGVATASFTIDALATGPHAIAADYAGDANDLPSATPAVGVIVGPDSTSTALLPSSAAHVFGQPETFTAIVRVSGPGAGIPTGVVTFQDGPATLGTGTLSIVAGVATASFTTNMLSTGPHAITAAYAGDANDLPGAAAAVGVTVAPAQTTTVLTPPSDVLRFGQPETLTATILVETPGAGTPTGTVTFQDGMSLLGTASLSSVNGISIATLTVPPPAPGGHAFTASYSGDANFVGSATTSNQSVDPASSTIVLIPSLARPTFGQPVTILADVSPVTVGFTPTGSVTFAVDGVAQPPVSLRVVNGLDQAGLTLPALPAGTHTITASYGGDPAFLGSLATLPLSIDPAESTTAFIALPAPAAFGQAVILTATVAGFAGIAPSGIVTFLDGPTPLGTATVGPGSTASIRVPMLATGIHMLSASYGGDLGYAPSGSPTVREVVAAPIPPVVDGPRVMHVTRTEGHGPRDTIAVQFDQALDPARARDAHNYRIVPLGRHGRPLGHPIAVRAVDYRAGSSTVTLHPASRLGARRTYELIVAGGVRGGVASTSGRLLDGSGSGMPGSDYVTVVEPTSPAGAKLRSGLSSLISAAGFDALAASDRLMDG